MSKLPKAIYRLNAIPTKNTNGNFHRTRTSNFFKICMEPEKSPSSQNNLEKEEQSRMSHAT